ncbi:DUF5777 family beta-barrel protein [Flavihumibacter petaseus]|uniref:DUF5777 domain-containing protein n=1 Tax=Flavihumibacter petaseus NBRC 106054 TaxID=1220578 RepID=A0A0E9N2P0_9BACT|nr:DUF5777 family beta-barrel protein [Flavihumibacter petaseus]GAO43901.1 hypothetical protein FPE01S_02_10070 [Flavihumibacter petaseus NBRC 106054]
MNKTTIIIPILLLHLFNTALAQDTTLNTKFPVTGTFKGTYIQNQASVESPKKGVLQVMIMHRFGRISDGLYDLFGLDNATIRLGFDYGITDKLAIGIGRSSYEKTYDASFKYRIFTQQSDNSMPLTTSLYAGLAYVTLHYPEKPYYDGKYRTNYFTQLLIARKFGSFFSLQLTPSWIHYNLVPEADDKNDVFAVGLGGRFRISKRVSFNTEYTYLLPDQVNSTQVYNSFSAGFDIETGGHVFQFVFSNSQGLVPTSFISQTAYQWRDGDIYFGFNLSRVFQLKKKKTVPSGY